MRLLTFTSALLLLSLSSACGQSNKFKPYVPPRPIAPMGTATTNQIRLKSVDGVLSTYLKCTISGAPVSQVFLAGLPANVRSDCVLVQQLEVETTRELASIEADEKQLRADVAAGPSQANSGTAAGNYIRQNNIRQNQIQDRLNALDTKLERLKTVRERFSESAEISAINTGRTYAGLQVWQVVAGNKSPKFAR